MGTLVLEFDGQVRELRDGAAVFGRDPTCAVVVGARDHGVSRRAGRVSRSGEYWVLTNLSDKRVLHAADPTGLVVPLPVALPGGPPVRRLIDQSPLTVLVPGDEATYPLTVTVDGVGGAQRSDFEPESVDSTRAQAPLLDERQKEVVVALARGYLRPLREYDPRPAGYSEVAAALGLTRAQVEHRLRTVRDAMERTGIRLPGDADSASRRQMCEWLLALRAVTPADLAWLEGRTADHSSVATPADLARAAAPAWPSSTDLSQRPHAKIVRSAERAGAVVKPVLRARLRSYHGPQWLNLVNRVRRHRGGMVNYSLDDERFCLSLLAGDEATRDWAPDEIRSAAQRLLRLTNQAHHKRAITTSDVDEAARLAEHIRNWILTVRR
ncbi:FHA domain-containing protein [Saccharothrix yanglingensis]|uniref:Uncharacterized protein n=1 Tax=Saccharothrix yanglingensis TaxID=659496 RepID=A0ABU0XBQ1_9PSEU|nr:FHA domain-containing protein [Saccharothrix yanglingensis]MDQ2589067.1 hypothetical protein [Saccharothrix yanglingensis]